MTGIAAGVLVAAALVAAALAALRLLRGPRQADRVVALDLLFAAALTLCIAAALASGRSEFLDVAIVLALVGFVATLGWAGLVARSSEDDHGG